MEYRGDQLPVLRTYGLPSREEALHVRVVDTTTRLEARRRDPAAAPLELQPAPARTHGVPPNTLRHPGEYTRSLAPQAGDGENLGSDSQTGPENALAPGMANPAFPHSTASSKL
jgi:hypothetical protein